MINHSNNEREDYEYSLDGSDNNFNFNNDYNDDVQSFSRTFIPLFYFLF